MVATTVQSESDFGIARLDYNDRQRIVVVEDHVLEADVDDGNEERPWSFRDLADRLPFVRSDHVPTTVPNQSLRAAKELTREGVRILPVARSEAAELEWSAGHPLDGLVYVGDPARPQSYYQLSDFHVRVFENKFADALRLLGDLGARGFTVRSEEGWGRKFAGKITFPVQAVPVTGKGGFRSRGSRKVLFSAELTPAGVEEPQDIAWLRYEPIWREIVDLRLKHGLRKFNLVVDNRSDHQITADVGVKIKKASLGIGGDYEAFVETKWVIEGEFAEMPKKGLFG